jgi:choline dehydrogenase-like flavoprotein
MPVAVDWQLDGREIANIREFVASTLSFLESNDLARVTARPDALDDDEGFLERIEDTYHQSGGLRMSRSPQTGVTDANCRVWGTQNVYVAGASVFPTSSYANCTLTALALGLRLANRLHQTELRAA